MPLSFLELVERVDSSPVEANGEVVFFKSHDGVTLGKCLPFVADKLASSAPDLFKYSHSSRTISLAPLETQEQRSKLIAEAFAKLRSDKVFAALEGWRDELYPVFHPRKSLYLLLERSASGLLGIVTYGCHITGYIPAEDPRDYQIWVPRRSYSKPTWPGMLDNTVAGGLGYPLGPWETAIKECQEEAGLPADYVEGHLRSTGVVTYEFQYESDLTAEAGAFQPEVEYTYDLVMEPGVVPQPEDGEVAEFYLMSVAETTKRLHAGEFKYNTALVLVDFYIRHGLITPESEPNYIEVVAHCHRQLAYPLR